MRLVSLIAGLSVAALAACSQEAKAPEAAPVPTVTDAFIVMPAPGRDVAMGGLTLSVEDAPIWLTAADTNIADKTELHTMSMEDGVMRMRKVERLEATPIVPLELERGGAHLMFFGISDEIAPGDRAELVLTLTDENGKEQTVTTEAEIRAMGE